MAWCGTGGEVAEERRERRERGERRERKVTGAKRKANSKKTTGGKMKT